MKEVSERQRQAGRDWQDLKVQHRAAKQARIIRFLRMNPDSTSDDIWMNCQAQWDDATKFLKRSRRKIDNRMVYRVDEKKLAAYFS